MKFANLVVTLSAIEPTGYHISQFSYAHHETYGSERYDHQGQGGKKTELYPSGIKISEDRLSVQIEIENLRAGFVTGIKAAGIRSKAGDPLRHDLFYYTLNSKP
ncbi:MAG: hypothetical protein CL790_02545 [Chloroflexi bacterium]|nr:hypothetical protein [Chloroflexota bacterium]|tara:strand:- start:374 stop:685 length:312 start_codon:yes stop_codon:yes gene_type:complete